MQSPTPATPIDSDRMFYYPPPSTANSSRSKSEGDIVPVATTIGGRRPSNTSTTSDTSSNTNSSITRSSPSQKHSFDSGVHSLEMKMNSTTISTSSSRSRHDKNHSPPFAHARDMTTPPGSTSRYGSNRYNKPSRTTPVSSATSSSSLFYPGISKSEVMYDDDNEDNAQHTETIVSASIEDNATSYHHLHGYATPPPPQKLIMQTMHRRGSISNGSSNENTSVGAKLVYSTYYGSKMEFPLNQSETSIGRREDNHIVLHDGKISKHHAIIMKTDKGYAVKDCNSSNGVRVNDALIEPDILHPISDQNTIQIGGVSLTFCDEPSTSSKLEESSEQSNSMDARPFEPTQTGKYSSSAKFTAGSVSSSLASSYSSGYGGMSGASYATIKERKTPDQQKQEFLNSLVTILPSEKKYEETVHIRAELEADQEEIDFKPIKQVNDVNSLKEDYEKLRLAYELSKMSVMDDINKLFSKSLDLMFDILPVDRGVVLLVDPATGYLSTHYVKLREGKANERREILLSSTILNKVYKSRKCLITSDAFEDPHLGKAASVRHGQIRSVICVPLIAHNIVHGILHLDSRDRIGSFSNKDLSLVKTISSQTAMAIENMNLIKEVEHKARITEQLSRFLPPHVVDKMTNRSEIIRKGGRETIGTIVFADIRGFTNLSEKSNPIEVVNLLNDYFERLVKIVFKYNGIVDKYIGDALMAVFGTLEDEADAEYRATAAGLEFQKAIGDMNTERARVGKEPISIGVGINTGEMIAGFIGSSQRLEYTCIGDTVNTSSRICSMAQEDQVLLSEETYEQISDRVKCRPVGYRQFKGKAKEVMVYEAIGLA